MVACLPTSGVVPRSSFGTPGEYGVPSGVRIRTGIGPFRPYRLRGGTLAGYLLLPEVQGLLGIIRVSGDSYIWEGALAYLLSRP
jgi:hypothetical protein